MTPRLLPRQAQEKLSCGDTDTAKGLLKQAQGANFTRYDFREGFSRRLLFPVKRGSIQDLLSQAIVLGYFPDTLDNLGREGRLVGEALNMVVSISPIGTGFGRASTGYARSASTAHSFSRRSSPASSAD